MIHSDNNQTPEQSIRPIRRNTSNGQSMMFPGNACGPIDDTGHSPSRPMRRLHRGTCTLEATDPGTPPPPCCQSRLSLNTYQARGAWTVLRETRGPTRSLPGSQIRSNDCRGRLMSSNRTDGKIYDNFVSASKDGIIGIIARTMSTLTD